MTPLKTTIDLLLELLKDNFGSDVFTTYYEGDPLQIPAASLPAISVTKRSGSVQQDATMMDKLTGQIFIRIIFDKKDDYGASDNIDLTERKIREIVEGRDDYGRFADGTILGIVRPHLTIGGSVIESNINWEYGIVPRGQFGGDVSETSEGQITISIQELVQVANRN